MLEHIIILTPTTSIWQRPYRAPEILVDPLKREIQLMGEMGVIEASTSACSSLIVLVPKKDGSLNFRKLNAVSKFDVCPLPRIEDWKGQVHHRIGSL